MIQGERSSDNLKNEGVSKAKILTFSDVKEYNYKGENTIRPEGERIYKNGKVSTRERTEVFVNLNKRYKNSRPQQYDVILALKSSAYCPRLIFFEDENSKMDMIYSNDVVFLRAINNEKIDPRFIFFIMNSTKIKEYLNVESEKNNPKRISCSMIEKIKIDLPPVEKQREIVENMIQNEINIDNLIG